MHALGPLGEGKGLRQNWGAGAVEQVRVDAGLSGLVGGEGSSTGGRGCCRELQARGPWQWWSWEGE